MARVTAPLLSLSASGKIADVLVASTWKGIPVMRQYVKPSNPQTADQVTQRTALTNVVDAWRNFYTDATHRTAWNRLALLLADTMSGFNAFVRNAVKVIVTDADASFCFSAVANAGHSATFTLKNIDDGAVADEAGNFEVWAGSSPDSLLLLESIAIAAGDVVGVVDWGVATDVRYGKLRKGGFDRSGIVKITVI